VGCRDPLSVRQDIHSISSLLKLYCRELPDPLCTYDLYDGFLRAARVPEEFRLGAMREVAASLPKEHFRCEERPIRFPGKMLQVTNNSPSNSFYFYKGVETSIW
jgi:hypothetical protein